MTDFERPLRAAVAAVYPNCRLTACYFHFTQAVRRKARTIPGFFKLVCADSARERAYMKTLSLPLLPASLINDEFRKLKGETKAMGGPFAEYMCYYERQWLVLVCIIFFICFLNKLIF